MFTIIHGSHRHGYHWRVTELLRDKLEEAGVEVKIIDLSQLEFEYCCGNQVCQDGDCIYKDDILSELFKKFILPADGIYIVTPTYFNMPTAKLKNFIDRSNALLPKIENTPMNSIFGAWVSGEADQESIECNSQLLSDYAKIMGWKSLKGISETVFLEESQKIKIERIQEIVEVIRRNLL